jgi:hypothetical protein
MALRNRPEVFALVKHDGGIVSKRNITAVEKAAGEGKYILKFPTDRFIRPETHRITVTTIGGDRRTAQLLELAGGNQIEVHTYHGNDHKDASFQFVAERL